MKNTTLIAGLCVLGVGAAGAQGVREITDADFQPGVDYTLSADTNYFFSGLVFVEEGSTLTIEPGTVLRFNRKVNQGDPASTLIIAKGGKIMANGTAEAPIIMTYEDDDVTDPNDLPDGNPIVRGQWGGLIILGNATVALDETGVGSIEGIDPAEVRAAYGGGLTPDDEESSGELRYVSIRHAGTQLGPEDEINGLTLGGVGSGTVIDYVEVFANLDDGIEFFGGTVDVKHAVVSYCGDDSYDYDLGWRGRGQFWFSLNGNDVTGRAGEWDGAIPDANTPFAQVTLSNATFVGPGTEIAFDEETGGDGADFAIVIRDGAGAKVYNSIITNFPANAINIEDREAEQGTDSYQRLLDGEIDFTGNIFGDFGRDDMGADSLIARYGDGDQPDGSDVVAELTDGNAFIGDASLLVEANVGGRLDASTLDPRPAEGSLALSDSLYVDLDDDFFDDVDYIGAFGRDTADFWVAGWTALDHYGYFAPQDFTGTRDFGAVARPLTLAPNPTSEGARLNFELSEASSVRIELYDINGRSLRATRVSQLPAGAQTAYVPTGDLTPGNYVVRLTAGGGSRAVRLVVR